MTKSEKKYIYIQEGHVVALSQENGIESGTEFLPMQFKSLKGVFKFLHSLGHYLYIEASSPRAPGHIARVISPQFMWQNVAGCTVSIIGRISLHVVNASHA